MFGAPHSRLGQIPRAEIVLGSDGCNVAALGVHCARELSSYKIPIDFAVVSAIEKTPGGKIVRR